MGIVASGKACSKPSEIDVYGLPATNGTTQLEIDWFYQKKTMYYDHANSNFSNSVTYKGYNDDDNDTDTGIAGFGRVCAKDSLAATGADAAASANYTMRFTGNCNSDPVIVNKG